MIEIKKPLVIDRHYSRAFSATSYGEISMFPQGVTLEYSIGNPIEILLVKDNPADVRLIVVWLPGGSPYA